MTTHPDDLSLGDARQWLRDRVDKGAPCPCCTRFTRIYRRKLNSSMAAALVHLARRTERGEFVHIFDFAQEHGFQHSDVPTLRFWGFLEASCAAPGDPPHERSAGAKEAGVWAITEAGRAFVTRGIPAPMRMHLFAGRLLGASDATTTIRQALGDKFDYDELMST